LANWLSLPPETQAVMGENARKCFEKYFDVEAAFRRLMVLFQQILHHNGR